MNDTLVWDMSKKTTQTIALTLIQKHYTPWSIQKNWKKWCNTRKHKTERIKKFFQFFEKSERNGTKWNETGMNLL